MIASCPSRRRGRLLRHRVFLALGVTIVAAVGIAGFVVHSVGDPPAELNALRAFANDQFAAVWDVPARRIELAEAIRRHFNVRVTLRDTSGSVLYRNFDVCSRDVPALDVRRAGQVIGRVEACVPPHGWPRNVALGLLSLVLILWAMSGWIARRLVGPLEEVVRVVRRIGDGQLDARMQLCGHFHRGDVGEVARAVNQMAEKIERQLAGQKELLAAVSHEVRSPLARLRMLVELERESQNACGRADERLESMDVELTELDSLIGQLLAQSRLEFQKLNLQPIDAEEVAKMALVRAGQPLDKLSSAVHGHVVGVDVTLFVRALLNLIENAERHGRGLIELNVVQRGPYVRFRVRDRGPGFDRQVEKQAFLPFVGSGKATGLGLGLALVAQIARGHTTDVDLESTPGQGAVVSIDARIWEGS